MSKTLEHALYRLGHAPTPISLTRLEACAVLAHIEASQAEINRLRAEVETLTNERDEACAEVHALHDDLDSLNETGEPRGAWISSNECSADEIAYARACNAFVATANSLGWVKRKWLELWRERTSTNTRRGLRRADGRE